MPLQKIDGTDLEYYLISFDEKGEERTEANGQLLSETVRKIAADAAARITDVFLISHGWKGDIPAAIEQYDRWVREMGKSANDIAAARRARDGFMPLVIGLHWPSLPWGDEKMPAGGGLLGVEEDEEVSEYAERISNTLEARNAIRTILDAAQRASATTDQLPEDVRQAYELLYKESGLTEENVGGAPGDDHETFDPDAIFQEALEGERAAANGPGVLGVVDDLRDAVLMPLRQLSFWKMKDRARRFGESGGHALLVSLQKAAGPDTHFHLMGHSFGCIVVSATIVGGVDAEPLVRPVDSLFLVQGALSLWSYCEDIPYKEGTAGYFHRIMKERLVRGPVVTTRSSFDTAVGRLYPKAAGLKGQLVLAPTKYPKYGGIGTFGVQGLADGRAEDLEMQPTTFAYGFEKGRVYNLEASAVIRHGDGFSGAHSDIAHPEVAHAMWEAVLAAP